jgi:hypothetical protein
VSVIPAGSRLIFRNGSTSAELRVLRDTPVNERWQIPVLAEADALALAGGMVEFPDDHGGWSGPAALDVRDGRLVLRSGDGTTSPPVAPQRRQDVRQPVHLPVRGMVLGTGLADEAEETAFEGVTLSLSAGGLAMQLMPDMTAVMEAAPQEEETVPRPGATSGGSRTKRLFLELELPEGPVVPAVVSLVGVQPYGVNGYLDELRGTFEDISAADRERLVRLIFEEERRLLRRRSGGQRPMPRW